MAAVRLKRIPHASSGIDDTLTVLFGPKSARNAHSVQLVILLPVEESLVHQIFQHCGTRYSSPQWIVFKLRKIVAWFQRWLEARDNIVNKVLKRWEATFPVAVTPKGKGGDCKLPASPSKQHLLEGNSEEQFKRKVILQLFQHKRSEFRRQFREYRCQLLQKQQMLQRVSHELTRGTSEGFVESALIQQGEELKKQLVQLKRQQPKFIITSSVLLISELQALTNKMPASKQSVQQKGPAANLALTGPGINGFRKSESKTELPSLAVQTGSSLKATSPKASPLIPSDLGSSMVTLSTPSGTPCSSPMNRNTGMLSFAYARNKDRLKRETNQSFPCIGDQDGVAHSVFPPVSPTRQNFVCKRGDGDRIQKFMSL